MMAAESKRGTEGCWRAGTHCRPSSLGCVGGVAVIERKEREAVLEEDEEQIFGR
jgi:hypothetical protein